MAWGIASGALKHKCTRECGTRFAVPVARMTCPRCDGTPPPGAPRCATCGGAGVIDLDECPTALAGPMVPACRAYGLMRMHGILPSAGGWLDQTAWFMDAVRLIDAEVAQADG